MEETLYNIEIHKDEGGGYLGKLFSDVDGMKEFNNYKYVDELLRDITMDMQLAFEEFSNRSADFADNQDVK